jgi:hypothetical protein
MDLKVYVRVKCDVTVSFCVHISVNTLYVQEGGGGLSLSLCICALSENLLFLKFLCLQEELWKLG